MKRFLVLGLVLVFGAVVTAPVIAEETGAIDTIHVVTPSWAKATHEDGTGAYFEIIRGVYEPIGIRLKYEIVPWKRAVLMVKQHEADALPGSYFISREDVDDLFPRYPIDMEIMAAGFRKGTVENWEGEKSLDGKRAVWLRGYNYDKYLTVDVMYEEIDKPEEGWRLIDAGRTDFYINALADMKVNMDELGIDPSQYELQPIHKKNLYLRFANTERSKKLIDQYDARMPELIESGELQRIFDKWGYTYFPFEPRE